MAHAFLVQKFIAKRTTNGIVSIEFNVQLNEQKPTQKLDVTSSVLVALEFQLTKCVKPFNVVDSGVKPAC